MSDPLLLIPSHEVAGPQEVRALLGTDSRSTFARRRAEPGFPLPFGTVSGVELWDARMVRAWLAARADA